MTQDASPTPDTPVAAGGAYGRSRADQIRIVLRCRCPRCGEGPLLKGYLTIRSHCPDCGLDYSFADPADGPAFFAMSLVGVVGMIGFMLFEFNLHPPVWVHMVVTLPILAAMCMGVLPPFKAWMVAEQYVHRAAEAEFVKPSDRR